MPALSRRSILALVPGAVLAACTKSTPSGSTAAASPTPVAPATPWPKVDGAVKVGLVFDIGGRGDNSFNDSADRGLERAKKELGAQVEVLEPGEGADREAALQQLASKNPDVLFGVGFLFTDDVVRVAQSFPKVRFACVDMTVDETTKLGSNVAALEFNEEQGSYLVGALAALTTKTKKVGFVGGMEIPLIKKFEAGYKAGVAAIDPAMPVIVKYAGTTGAAFKDPATGKALALAIYGQGADVIFHASGSTGQGVFAAAQEQGKLAIGVDSDQAALAPGHVLTSMVKHVDVAVFETIKAVKEGRYQSGIQRFDLKSGGVDYVYDDKNKALIPDAVHAKVEELRAKIVSGAIKVPFA